MDKPRLTRKSALLGAVGLVVLVGLSLLVAAGMFLLGDSSTRKARLEAAASQALGMQVSIAGEVAFAFFPGLRLTLGEVRVRCGESEFLSARRAIVAVGLRSLFFGKHLRIEKIVLEQPTIAIARQRDGRFNFSKPVPVASEGQAAQAARAAQAAQTANEGQEGPDISFTGGTVVYADERFGKELVARDCRADVRRVRHAGGQGSKPMPGLSFTADIRCAEVHKDGFALADLALKVDAKDGVMVLDPLTVRVFDAPGTGRLRADLTQPVPAYTMAFAVQQFPIESFFRKASLKQIGTGRMDFSAQLSTHGVSERELRQALQGTLSLRGKGLVFSGGDLDRTFERFESSQTLDLFDVGAVFLAGPLGLLVTKGYDFATLASGSEGRSEIRTLVSEWKVERGVAHARDVAMATSHNRVALQGRLDLINHRFDEVTLAMIDAKGCATVRQRVTGSFRAPVVERPNLLESLAGPGLRLLRRGGDLLRGEGCEVFYAGSVAAPK